ncbi:PH domain-containing protein [Planosporangium sp. 12N6]|uniref:PH domain-containing protein n=1 Tax=Planosporangium spinosum TaxID=3402278 RepID=UPI003CF6485A
MTTHWHRPYSPGPGRWFVVAWELFGLAFFGWTTERALRPSLALTPPGIIALVVALFAAWVLISYRILRMGVYVSDRGVRVRGLLRTRTVRWAEVERVTVRETRHSIGRFQVAGGLSVQLDPHDGPAIETTLWAQGIDFAFRRDAFHAAYRELRRHLTAYRERSRDGHDPRLAS